MERFTIHNTEGYSQADLDRLNARFEAEMATVEMNDADDIIWKSHQDYIAQTVLADFDSEES